jgi:hypothetical protein
LQRRLHRRHVGAVLLLGSDFLELQHHSDELSGLLIIARFERGMDRHRMFGPDIDEPGGEAPRADRVQRRRPGLGEAADPDDVRARTADRLGEPQRGWRGPFHAGDARGAAQPLDGVEADAIVAQIQHQRKAAACLRHPLDIGNDAARRHEGIERLMHHERRGSRRPRGFGERAGIADRAADACEEWNATADLSGDRLHHRLGLLRGEAVKLPGVAVGNEDVDARADGPVDDRLQASRRDLISRVERRHKDA